MEKILNKILNEISGLKTEVSGINEKVNKIETRMGSIETRMGSIETRMESMESRMDHLEKGQEQIINKIDLLSAKSVGEDGMITRMVLSQEETRKDIVEMKETMVKLEIRVKEIDVDVSKNKEQLLRVIK